jgi:hypothetical protein
LFRRSALRRQLWQLDYFTEGSIPDALIGVPQGWTPDQIKQFQDYWDTEFAGDLARRRRAKFVPGDTAAKVVQTKEPQHIVSRFRSSQPRAAASCANFGITKGHDAIIHLSAAFRFEVPPRGCSYAGGTSNPRTRDDFDEWLARIVCFAFLVPPQWAVKQMNRATADNQSAQSEEEGLEPTKEWVKDLIDEIIAEEFASPDLELHWLDEDDGAAENEAAPGAIPTAGSGRPPAQATMQMTRKTPPMMSTKRLQNAAVLSGLGEPGDRIRGSLRPCCSVPGATQSRRHCQFLVPSESWKHSGRGRFAERLLCLLNL